MAELPATLGEALAAARGRIPAGEARMFPREVTGCTAAQVAAYPERGLAAEQAARYVELLDRRAAGAFRVGAVLFSNQYGPLGQTRTAKELLDEWKNG